MKVENEKSRVYRYKTLEEIARALQDFCSLQHVIIFILVKKIFLFHKKLKLGL